MRSTLALTHWTHPVATTAREARTGRVKRPGNPGGSIIRRWGGLLAGLGLLVGLLAGEASAQTNTGTAFGQFMLIEPSARVTGMGNAGVSLYEGIQGAYYNPAALGPLEGAAIQLSHGFWYAGIKYDYAAIATPLRGLGTVFLSLTSLNSGEIDVRTVDQPLGTGERFSVKDLGVGLGYGRQITNRFAAGVQLNFLTESIWRASASAFGFNMGTVYRLSENGLRIGASLSNFGARATFSGDALAVQWDRDHDTNGDNGTLPAYQFTDNFPLPVLFRVGLGYPVKLGAGSELLLAVDAFHPRDNTESMSAGAEWSWRDTIALRAGYQRMFQQDNELGPTLGVGVRAGSGHPWFHVDYAWAAHDQLQDTHRVTMSLTF